jgi:hypothetical protein
MKRTIRSLVLLVSVFLFWTYFNAFASVVIDNSSNSAYAAKNKKMDKRGKSRNKKIILKEVWDSPDPFSVAAHGTATFQAEFDVRKTDGLGAKSDKTGKQFFIQHTFRITDAATGSELVVLSGKIEASPTKGKKKKKDKFIPVLVTQTWDGADAQGNLVPAGHYRYEVQGVFIRVDQKKHKKKEKKKEREEKIKIIGKSNKLAGEITIDSTPPVISKLSPADGSILATARPGIYASWEDNLSGIDVASVAIILDGNNLTAQANVICFE